MKNKTHLCDDFSLREKALIMFLMKLSLVSSNGSMICQEKIFNYRSSMEVFYSVRFDIAIYEKKKRGNVKKA